MTLDKSIGKCIYETIITNAEYIDTSLELMEFYQTHPEIQCEEKIEESFW